jgi:hypothetical protein
MKVTIYWTIIRPVEIYGSEVWTWSKSDGNTSAIWEIKIQRRIFGPVKEIVCGGFTTVES